MSEVTPQTETGQTVKEREESLAPRKPLSPLAKRLLGIGLGVLTFFVVSGIVNFRLDAVRSATFGQGVDALAQAIVDPVLVSDRNKLGQIVQRSASASGYETITIYGREGQVLASTNRLADQAAAIKLESAPEKARVTKENSRLVARRAIFLAEGNRIGAIKVTALPR
ncbi:MAG: hypothetical protein MUC92_12010 [Fimbriimonadaceae bacterium]|jgi:hypothetical protein|nr:hypothetical protein [Fimbriimonadaceae bacterium]